MSLRGRKRKTGPRHPNGERVIRREDPRSIALAQPHRRQFAFDQKCETPLGMLNLYRIITDEQYEAARRFELVVARYRAVISAPRSTAVSAPMNGLVDSGLSVAPDLDDEEAERRKAAYDDAYIALQDAGRPALKVVNAVALHMAICAAADFEALKCGLDALAHCFGLTNRRGASNSRNIAC